MFNSIHSCECQPTSLVSQCLADIYPATHPTILLPSGPHAAPECTSCAQRDHINTHTGWCRGAHYVWPTAGAGQQWLTNITDCASVVTCTFVPKPTPHIWLQMATSMNIAFILYLLHTFIFYHCYDSLWFYYLQKCFSHMLGKPAAIFF